MPLKHLDALANFIISHKPDKIVCLGDWWDLPSLSSYDKGKLQSEGRRLKHDIQAGNDALRRFFGPIDDYNKYKTKNAYKPQYHFLIGNHEERLMRFIADNAHLEHMIGYEQLDLDRFKTHDFLKVFSSDGIHYSHYFVNPMSGRPYGGSIQNVLNKLGYSFVMGHQQKLDFARKDLSNGKVIQGLVAGAFYMHDEPYKGYQGNHHWRGVCLLHNVKEGNFDLEIISLERLIKTYL